MPQHPFEPLCAPDTARLSAMLTALDGLDLGEGELHLRWFSLENIADTFEAFAASGNAISFRLDSLPIEEPASALTGREFTHLDIDEASLIHLEVLSCLQGALGFSFQPQPAAPSCRIENLPAALHPDPDPFRPRKTDSQAGGQKNGGAGRRARRNSGWQKGR